MKFEMSETQRLKLEEWQEAISKVYGRKGDFEFTFKPNGVGYSISVYSELKLKIGNKSLNRPFIDWSFVSNYFGHQ